MGLQEYRKKRDFKKSPEPNNKGKASKDSLLFVIQKHAATHLHYDLRLEHKGVLLSWAVPKGPPSKAGDKRLAIQVEDHPLSYANFEGVIPKGSYGAGKVQIWDEGTYAVGDSATKRQSAKAIEEGLAKGHLALVFKGKKIKGSYDLVRLKRGDQDNLWLFIKRKRA